MIPLAIVIEGKLVFVIVAAAVGAINWWLEKKKKAAESGAPQPPAAPLKPIGEGAGNESEKERLRRFLEALGVPQGERQPPQPQRQIPASPQPPRPPRAGVRTRDRQAQAPRPVQKPAQKILRPTAQPVAIEPGEMHRAGRIEDAAASIERISGEFDAMNVRVALPPVQTLEMPAHLATANAGTTSVLERDGNPLVASLRRMLTNPTEIRAAFLAAELLGPPRGLQR